MEDHSPATSSMQHLSPDRFTSVISLLFFFFFFSSFFPEWFLEQGKHQHTKPYASLRLPI